MHFKGPYVQRESHENTHVSEDLMRQQAMILIFFPFIGIRKNGGLMTHLYLYNHF